ncbi:MAG: hypothetical protein K2O12_00440 [Muribaculaceae bacterium]|nr:hypothetical protein [Muribaculaceae bacterium]
MESNIPMPQAAEPATARRSVSVGLPAGLSSAERRFPLTPECAGMLVDRGYSVRIESGAAECINYTDYQYARAGVEISSRADVLKSDIVISLAPLSRHDATLLRRGAVLFGLLHADAQDNRALEVLLERGVTAIALDLIGDMRGNMPFADILAEIDGRASIAIASSLLADPAMGKGILIGGVAGIVPCEVTVLGSGIAAVAAARSAVGLGAMVRMFDNDAYRLRDALRQLGPGVVGSAIHRHVLEGALRSADIVIATEAMPYCVIGAEEVAMMKKGVITFDLSHGGKSVFPSLPTVDLAVASPRDNDMVGKRRVCYVNAGNAVPRTSAMALGNTFLTLINDITACDGLTNALKIRPGLRQAVYTYLGRPVNRRIADIMGLRYVDINLFLQFS